MPDNITAARICPNCGKEGVVYGSHTVMGGRIERHRKCQFCGERWATIERYYRPIKHGSLTSKTSLLFYQNSTL